ncbi:MAG: metal ABC transporter permease [Candidatus Rokubacteria bacterium]|nr:metal ABC transporter permease [Candidatus Rokubacteria bacterium]
MPEFLEYGFMHRAFAAGVVTALICPAIGVFLVPRRLSLIADTLAHVALAGVALGLLLGISPLIGALAVTLAAAIGIEHLRARGTFQGDAALAVFLSGGFAVAVVLISLARGFNADLFAILFGSILTVSPSDVWIIGALGAVVAVAIRLSYPQLLAITLNEDLARTSGVSVGMLNVMLTVLTALTTVVAMRMVGVLLVSAMIVIPTLTGFALARSFRQALGLAMAAGVVAMMAGLVVAYHLRLAAGGAVVLTALVLLAGATAAGRLRPSPAPRAW